MSGLALKQLRQMPAMFHALSIRSVSVGIIRTKKNTILMEQHLSCIGFFDGRPIDTCADERAH